MKGQSKRKKVLIVPNPLSPSAGSGHSPPKGERNKVLVALSGGIDSAVSAYLLIKQGFQVEAAFMKNWSSTKGLIKSECPWLSDRREALRVAAFLHIPLHTVNFEKQYQKKVMNYFFREYKVGRTPNPDVMCNKEIKFKLLYEWAMKREFNYLATGHYARIKNVVKMRGRANHQLLRSADEFKDQTYFIYNIKPEQLSHLLFPIGGMKKKQVRALAKKIGLPNADRKESMGLCFVGKIRLAEFLRQKIKPRVGLIIDQDNKTIGQHHGLHNYTIGQRHGINVGGAGPYYVIKKDLKRNRLYVTNNQDDNRLLTKEVQIHSVNWITPVSGIRYQVSGKKTIIRNTKSVIRLLGRYRHQGELVPLTISQIKKDLYRVVFKKPQKAIASGQSLVLYQGKVCLGGGIIV